MDNSHPIDTPQAVGSTRVLDEVVADTVQRKEEMVNIPYRELVGSLLYAAISTRPDISHAVHQLGKHVQLPAYQHWLAGKRVLRYLSGTKQIGLIFKGVTSNEMNLEVYSDADHANDQKDRKSVTGIVVKLNGDVISWISKKQSIVTDSTCYSEYVAMAMAVQEAQWTRQLLEELGLIVKSTKLYCDNEAAVVISQNHGVSKKSKHIEIKYHVVREAVDKGLVEVEGVSTNDQQADILTKALPRNVFCRIRDKLMALLKL
jgi:hypothetical protein